MKPLNIAATSSPKIPLRFVAAIMLLVFLTTSCQSGPNSKQGKTIGLPPAPPAYPPARNVPLDPQLQAAARHELQLDLHSQNPSVRAHALEAVRDTTGTQDAAQIIAALNDPDPLVRYAACLAAGELKIEPAHAALLRAASDQDSAVRAVARFALHCIGDTHLSHQLEKLSQDAEPRVRGTTAMVLGLIGDPSALKILRRMRFDSYPAVRQDAAEAMWRLGDEQGMKDLLGWSISHYQDDQIVALLALAAPHNRRIISRIRGGLTTESLDVNLAAARAMGELGCDEGYGVAMQGVKSAEPPQRTMAAFAFGAIGRTDAQPMLRTLLADSDANVRIAAATAILQLKPDLVIQCSG